MIKKGWTKWNTSRLGSSRDHGSHSDCGAGLLPRAVPSCVQRLCVGVHGMIWLTWATVAGPAWLRRYYILKCTPCRQRYRAQISGVNRCPLPLKRWPLGERLKHRLARTQEHDVETPTTPNTPIFHNSFLPPSVTARRHFYKITTILQTHKFF